MRAKLINSHLKLEELSRKSIFNLREKNRQHKEIEDKILDVCIEWHIECE